MWLTQSIERPSSNGEVFKTIEQLLKENPGLDWSIYSETEKKS